MPKTINKKGFTLIELMVVIVILGILSTLGLNSFRASQLKSRDAKRKSDLEQVQRALEMYFNDHGSYPLSSPAGGGTISSFSWGEEMKDAKDTVYMKELPSDPTGNPEYCYKSTDGSSYQIYAKLEGPKIGGSYSCGGDSSYNYGVASPNSTP